jgi:hypothetical protein
MRRFKTVVFTLGALLLAFASAADNAELEEKCRDGDDACNPCDCVNGACNTRDGTCRCDDGKIFRKKQLPL